MEMSAIGATKLADFVRRELKERGLSARNFAQQLDIAPSTLTYLLNEVTTEPSMKLIRALHRVTGKPLRELLSMAYPDFAYELDQDERFHALPDDVISLAINLNRLPPAARDFIIKAVMSATPENREEIMQQAKLKAVELRNDPDALGK